MYLRLAFSIAAHFEPEVLLMDEIIAVGDISFQEKCFAKMKSVSRKVARFFWSVTISAAFRTFANALFLLRQWPLCEEQNPQKVISLYVNERRRHRVLRRQLKVAHNRLKGPSERINGGLHYR